MSSVARQKAFISWSSGKDSAFALHEMRKRADIEVIGALTTVNATHDRVAMHGVRRELLAAQAKAMALPMLEVPLPYPCPNEVYESRMETAVAEMRNQEATQVIFGDLFLEDIRDYREKQMTGTGMGCLFPLWNRDTAQLAQDMIDEGVKAHVVCVDPKRLDRSFAGRSFDRAFLSDLPEEVDPCGENGEFHTIVTAGPMYQCELQVAPGEVVERDGLVYADFLLKEPD